MQAWEANAYIAIIRASLLDVSKHGIGDRGPASNATEAALFNDSFLLRLG
jgi:hypothetical protein